MKASTHAAATVPVWFEGYSRSLVRTTSVFLLKHHASRMRGLRLDSRAVAYLQKEADSIELQLHDQDMLFLPSTVPPLFESYSRSLVLHTGAFLLEHHAITMRGLHLDPQAVAYLEEAAQVVEQQMDDQDAAFPDLLNNAILEILRQGSLAHGMNPPRGACHAL